MLPTECNEDYGGSSGAEKRGRRIIESIGAGTGDSDYNMLGVYAAGFIPPSQMPGCWRQPQATPAGGALGSNWPHTATAPGHWRPQLQPQPHHLAPQLHAAAPSALSHRAQALAFAEAEERVHWPATAPAPGHTRPWSGPSSISGANRSTPHTLSQAPHVGHPSYTHHQYQHPPAPTPAEPYAEGRALSGDETRWPTTDRHEPGFKLRTIEHALEAGEAAPEAEVEVERIFSACRHNRWERVQVALESGFPLQTR
jgi:hypothetical protein